MSNTDSLTPKKITEMTETEFVERFGGVYEHSPWIAQETWQTPLSEPHNTLDGLHQQMQIVVSKASHDALLTLIKHHPDLAGKAAIDGTLTKESTSEQSGAGIDQCTAEEFALFEQFNGAYKEKFGFPFIMAVKGSNRHLILAAFEKRLKNDEQTEFDTAINEIHKIARFRLEDLFA